MRFFLPYWDDKVYAQYDFLKDEPIDGDTSAKNYAFLWDFYSEATLPIDGLLISKTNLLNESGKLNRTGKSFVENGIHNYIRFSKKFPIIGDCGAFSYIMKKDPPYDPLETLEYYYKCGFDFGIIVDHLIVPATYQWKEYRSEITLKNAKIMYEAWSSDKNYKRKFQLLGVAQGWDVTSYCNMTQQMLNLGFEYIAIGGVARTPTIQLIPILQEISQVVKKFSETHNKHIDLHVLGVGRPNLLRTYQLLGITSFDTASNLRQAWLGSKNYQQEDSSHTAIRIRFTKNPEKEKTILEAIKLYSQGNVDLTFINQLFLENDDICESKIRWKDYQETLESHAWEKCTCEICKQMGIEVTIFRGNNRNRRRGFHNIWNYYHKKFKIFLPKLCFLYKTTKFKNGPVCQSLPSKIWKQIFDLPIELFVTDGSRILHYNDYSNRLEDTSMLNILERNSLCYSNDAESSYCTHPIDLETDDLRKLLLEELMKIQKKIHSKGAIKKLEGKENHQPTMDSYLKT